MLKCIEGCIEICLMITPTQIIFYMLYKMKYKWMGSDYVTCMGAMYMYFPYLELEGLSYS